jgi:hypothetical protein
MHFRRSRCEPLQVLAPIASVGEATGLPLWEFRQRGQGEEHTEIITASTGLGQLNHASNGVSELRMLFAGCPSWPGTRSFADRPPGALLSLSHPQITAPGPEAELKNNGPSLDDSTGRPPPNGGCHLLHACIYIYIYPPEIVTPATKETAEALPLAPRLASEGEAAAPHQDATCVGGPLLQGPGLGNQLLSETSQQRRKKVEESAEERAGPEWLSH